jgi:hypothetical protein
LIDETIQTLSLLLPLNERETTSWFLKQQIEYHLDSEAVRCKSLAKEERIIDSFAYVPLPTYLFDFSASAVLMLLSSVFQPLTLPLASGATAS